MKPVNRTPTHGAGRLLLLLLLAIATTLQGHAAGVADRLQIQREREHAGQVVFIAPFAKGERIASVDYMGRIHVWDARSLRQLSSDRQVPFLVRSASFVGDRLLLVAGSSPRDILGVVDLGGHEAVRTIGRAGGETISYAKATDTRLRAVIVNESVVRVVEIDVARSTMTELRSIANEGLQAASLSEDGKLLAIGTSQSQLRLMDVESGAWLWSRQVDKPLTSLAIAKDARSIVGAYDNVIAFTLKRIDVFALDEGRTIRTISSEPCSVFQVNVVGPDRASAICGRSELDRMAHFTKQMPTTFLSWSLSDEGDRAVARHVPGPELSFLPFPAGTSQHGSGDALYFGSGDGAIYQAPSSSTGPQLARFGGVAPQGFSRLAVSVEPHKTYAITNASAVSRSTEDSAKLVAKLRALAAKDTGADALAVEQLDKALDPEFAQRSFRSSVRIWDAMTGVGSSAPISALGLVTDVAPLHGGRAIVAEVLTIPTHLPAEPTVFAVSSLDESGLVERRNWYSLDSDTGRVQSGLLRRATEPKAELSVCPAILQPGNLRLSGDGQALALACIVLPTNPREPSQYLAGDVDLIAAFLDERGTVKLSTRTRVAGFPVRVELSKDGRLAAVWTSFTTIKSGGPDTDTEYALIVVDTEQAKVLKTLRPVVKPALGQSLQFTPDGRSLFFTDGPAVFRMNVNGWDVVPIDEARGAASSVSSIALDAAGSLLAVARHDGTTRVRALADNRQITTLRHPTETFAQMAFDRGQADRLVAAPTEGGLVLFDLAQGKRLVEMLTSGDENWITVAPDGVFAASVGGEQSLTVSTGTRAAGVDQLYDLYFRPELLRKRLDGQLDGAPLPVEVGKALSSPPPQLVAHILPDADDKARILIDLRESGGGIGGVRVFHNGKLTHDLGRDEILRTGIRSQTKGTQSVRLQLEMPVATGDNEYVISASNKQRTMQSRFVKLAKQGPSAPASGRKAYLLMIGTNTFEDPAFQTLVAAEGSSRQVGASIRRRLDSLVGPEHVVLIDLIGTGTRSPDVEAGLRRLEQQVQPDDVVAMVVTTHGQTTRSGELFVALRDSTAEGARSLTASRLIAAMNRMTALSQVLVLDICRAGLLNEQISAIYQDRFSVFAGRAGIHVIAAASAQELALAQYNSTTAFGHYFIEALESTPGPATARRSIRSVASKVRSSLLDLADKFKVQQVPMIYSFGRDLSF
jgi:WD40 repeat protein